MERKPALSFSLKGIKRPTDILQNNSQIFAPDVDKQQQPAHDRNKEAPLSKQEDVDDDEPWLQKGLLVTIRNTSLRSGVYTDRQAVVERLHQEYGAEVQVLGKGDVLLLDQDELLTVLPAPGEEAIIVRGPHRGSRVRLIVVERFKDEVEVEILDQRRSNHRLLLPSSYVCKMHQ